MQVLLIGCRRFINNLKTDNLIAGFFGVLNSQVVQRDDLRFFFGLLTRFKFVQKRKVLRLFGAFQRLVPGGGLFGFPGGKHGIGLAAQRDTPIFRRRRRFCRAAKDVFFQRFIKQADRRKPVGCLFGNGFLLFFLRAWERHNNCLQGNHAVGAKQPVRHAPFRVEHARTLQVLSGAVRLVLFFPKLPHNQIGFEGVGQFVQHLFRLLDSLFTIAGMPVRFSKRNAQIHAVGVVFKVNAKFLDGEFIALIAQMDASKRRMVHLQTPRTPSGMLFVQIAQLFAHIDIVRLQFKRAHHVPDGFVEQVALCVDKPQPGVGDKILGVGAEYAAKEVNGVIMHAFFQRRLRQQTIRREIAREQPQNMLRPNNRLIVGFLFQKLIYFLHILRKGQLLHAEFPRSFCSFSVICMRMAFCIVPVG